MPASITVEPQRWYSYPDYQSVEKYLWLKSDKKYKAARILSEQLKQDDRLKILFRGLEAKKNADLNAADIAPLRNMMEQIIDGPWYPLLHDRVMELNEIMRGVRG